jgi:hypothetical protein
MRGLGPGFYHELLPKTGPEGRIESLAALPHEKTYY